jgi:hypothetical protein
LLKNKIIDIKVKAYERILTFHTNIKARLFKAKIKGK